MTARDALWDSARAQALISAKDLGGAIRLARATRGWRQADLGHAAGYSASTISRVETGRRPIDLPMLRRVAHVAGIPADVLVRLLDLPGTSATVAETGKEDRMRRRTFIAAAGLAVPAHLLAALDDALVILPSPAAAPTAADVAARLRAARALFDSGDLPQLAARLPQVIAAAHAGADDGVPDGHARLAACYDLTTEFLNKIGSGAASRVTADRAAAHARMSGSPIAMAAAARSLGIVLRHEGRHPLAERVTLQAAADVEATGLTTPAQAATYAQMLCTCAYNAAHAGDRDRALEMITEAERAAARLPARPVPGQPFTVTPAHVALYRVGVHWSLGDPGAALHAGRNLHASQFSTPERRGRLHTDLARAWWLRGDPEQTARALLAAYGHAPAEIRERPSIRDIVTQLATRHPHVAGVQRLAVVVGHASRN